MRVLDILSRCAVAVMLVVGLALAAAADAAAPVWSGWVEQAGQRWPLQGRITLAAAPFRIVLEAPADHGYVAVTAANGAELAGEPAPLARLLRGTNVGAEGGPGQNTFLVVNRAGAIARDMPTTQVWDDDAETDVHSFTERTALPDGRMRSVRLIDEICFQPHRRDEDHCMPLARTGLTSATMVIATLPPVDEMRPMEPRRVEFVFN